VRVVDVIEDPAAAAAALDPIRARLLAELADTPASAGGVAERVGLTRQQANYHLRTLEQHGLVELAEVRARGGISERILRSTAASYVVSPAAVGDGAASPERVRDQRSADYLIALGARVVRELGALVRRAGATGRRLPTLAIDTELRFASAADRTAFADELTAAVVDLAARYHHDDGRPHRLVVASYPRPATDDPRRRVPSEPTTHEEHE
jgi:DNA-binding transcriptional ArsR family regulator